MRSSRCGLYAGNGRDGQYQIAQREVRDKDPDVAQIEGKDRDYKAQPERAVPVIGF